MIAGQLGSVHILSPGVGVQLSSYLFTNPALSRLTLHPILGAISASTLTRRTPSRLEAYEHLGLVVPKRTSTNRRRFSQRDVMKLQTIQKLTRQHSVNLAGVRYIMKLLKLLHENQLTAP